jgi:serine/threonine protein kinase
MLPAWILKIMRGTFAPIFEHYSDSLQQHILEMLHTDPNKRPTVSQIMAQPMILDRIGS